MFNLFVLEGNTPHSSPTDLLALLAGDKLVPVDESLLRTAAAIAKRSPHLEVRAATHRDGKVYEGTYWWVGDTVVRWADSAGRLWSAFVAPDSCRSAPIQAWLTFSCAPYSITTDAPLPVAGDLPVVTLRIPFVYARDGVGLESLKGRAYGPSCALANLSEQIEQRVANMETNLRRRQELLDSVRKGKGMPTYELRRLACDAGIKYVTPRKVVEAVKEQERRTEMYKQQSREELEALTVALAKYSQIVHRRLWVAFTLGVWQIETLYSERGNDQ